MNLPKFLISPIKIIMGISSKNEFLSVLILINSV